MPPTARMGSRFLTIMGITTALGLLVQGVNFAQIKNARMPELPSSIEGYDRRSTDPPVSDAQRDAPQSLNFSYDQGDLPPIRVSIARADTLNAYREATHILLDTDGRVLAGQEGTMSRAKDRLPMYNFMIASGRSDIILALHWTQAPGEDPALEPLDAPGKIVESLMAKKPVFVCDLWVSDREDLKGIHIDDLIQKFATQIDRVIKAMPK